MTDSDHAIIAEFINSALADLDIPPAPYTWWEICLPAEMSVSDVEDGLGDALGAVDETVVDPARTRLEKQAVVSTVQEWFGNGESR